MSENYIKASSKLLEFDCTCGKLTISTPLFFSENLKVMPAYPVSQWNASDGGFIGKSEKLTFRMSFLNPSPNEAMLSLEISTDQAEGVRLEQEVTLGTTPKDTAWNVNPTWITQYIHGVLSDPCGVKALGGMTSWGEPYMQSKVLTVFYDEALQQAVLIGVLPSADAHVTIATEPEKMEGSGSVGWNINYNFSARLMPDTVFSAGTLLFLRGDNPTALLEEYGKRWADAVSPTGKPVRVGWNSWDYYAGSVQQSDIEENLQKSQEVFGDKLKTWVIDAGWERQWGAWQANWKFPEGLSAYCALIRDAGCQPGIWIAPLHMNIYAPETRYRPDWFVQDANSQPLMQVTSYGMLGILDPTRSEVREFIIETFTALKQAGFTYFKLDFIHNIFAADHFQDKSVTPLQAVRMTVQTIRDVVGDDAYITGVGAFMEECPGLLDGARFANDIHDFWDCIKRIARSASVHYWKQGRLWNNDVDFAIIRCAELSDDPFLNRPYVRRPLLRTGGCFPGGPEADLEECRTWLSICYLSGGEMIMGDALAKLASEGHDMLRRVLTPLSQAARPLDLFSCNTPPTRWLANTKEGWIMGYFNWTDHIITIQMNPDDWGETSVVATDFWNDDTVEIGKIQLPPHHSRIFKLKCK